MLTAIGVSATVLFIVKIGIHSYIRDSVGKEIYLGSFGNYTNLVYLLPIMESVKRKLRTTQLIGNIIYWIALALFVLLVIMHAEGDG